MKEEFPFVQFTENFPYEKAFYDVRLASGEIVKHCWPNAGVMNSICGDGRKWNAADNIQIRRSLDHPEDKQHPNVVIIGHAPDARLVAQVQALAAAQNTVVVLDEPMPHLANELKDLAGLTENVAKLDAFKLRPRPRRPSRLLAAGLMAAGVGLLGAATMPTKPPITNHDLMRLRRAEQKRQRKNRK